MSEDTGKIKSWNRFECGVGGVLTKHGPINVISPNNTSKWQIRFNSAFKGLIQMTDDVPVHQTMSATNSINHFHTHCSGVM